MDDDGGSSMGPISPIRRTTGTVDNLTKESMSIGFVLVSRGLDGRSPGTIQAGYHHHPPPSASTASMANDKCNFEREM